MLFRHALFSLVLIGNGSALNSRSPIGEISSAADKPDTGRFIIELAEGADFDDAVTEIESRPGIKVVRKLRSPIFNGVTVEAPAETEDTLVKSPRAAQAWRSHKIQLMPNVEMSHFVDGLEATNYSVHGMTGVDRQHAEGILGKGVKIAVVDTGVDYNHPALGSGFGPGYKVIGGHDFVGNGLWPDADKMPDEDPMDQMGHGTHVTGIIVGKNDWYTGVAPEASILAYKVFTEVDYTDDDTLIEAFLQAYEDGADIITCSVGEYDGWSNGAWATVSSRLVEEGVVVTIAAGNSGQQGPFKASSGSSGKNVLAVASVDPTAVLAIPMTAHFVSEEETRPIKIGYRPGPLVMPTNVSGPVYPLSLNASVLDDACSPLPDDTPDLSDKLVLVRLSLQCDDSDQVANIALHNPMGIVFYQDNQSTSIDPYTTLPIFLAMITADVGEAMVKTIAEGGKVTMDFSEIDGYVKFPLIGGGGGSFYTSWGGTWELELKPEIAAPGAAITSTYPTWLGSWATLSGTSMATPYVAGVAALYISKYGGRDVHGKGFALMLNGRIQGSGSAMAWPGNVDDGGQHLASPAQVGTGLIDARKVVQYSTQLSFTKFHLNDTHHFSRYQGVDITNTGDEEITYTYKVEDAGGFDALHTDPNVAGSPGLNRIGVLQFYKLKPSVKFPAGTTRVKPGETKHVEFIFDIPTLPGGHESSSFPVVSGKILITGSNGEQVSVPYFGMVTDLKRETRTHRIFRVAYNLPRMITSTDYGPTLYVWDKPYWGFNLTSGSQDWPALEAGFMFGATELRWDIFEPGWKERNWKYPPVVGENGFVGSVAYWRESSKGWLDLTAGDDPDDVLPMPAKYIPSEVLKAFLWFGKLENGTQIAPGNYTMRVAALLPFGNREASDNWDIMDLPPQIKILG